MVTCRKCASKFNTLGELLIHRTERCDDDSSDDEEEFPSRKRHTQHLESEDETSGEETELPAEISGEETVLEDEARRLKPNDNAEVYKCGECEAEFGTVQALTHHAQQFHQDETGSSEEEDEPMEPQRQQIFRCGQCEIEFQNLIELRAHRRTCHPDNMHNIREVCNNFRCEDCTMEPAEGAFSGRYRSVLMKPSTRCITMEQFITATRQGMQRVLEHCLDHGEHTKVFCTVSILMHKIKMPEGTVEKEDLTHMSTRAMPLQTRNDINEFIDNVKEKLERHIDKYTSKGSNWVVASIEQISLRLVRYHLLRGGAASFTLPKELASKQCVLNIESRDEDCLKYAIVAGLHHEEIGDQHNRNRRNNYERFMDRYDFRDITLPATAMDLQVFERNNHDVAINALYYIKAANGKPGRVTPLYHPPLRVVRGRRMVNILFFDNHWLPITNLDKLLSTKSGSHNAYCYRCLRNLYRQDRLEQHMERCYKTTGQKEVMPKDEEARMQFNDWSHMLSPPFVMYADMEALLVPPDVANNKILQTHVPCAVGSYLVAHPGPDDPPQLVVFQQGENCVEEFCEYLDRRIRQLYQYNRDHCNKPQQRNDPAQVQQFEAAVECDYCKAPFSDAVPKVWHHCHISGRLLGTVCQRCNTRIH